MNESAAQIRRDVTEGGINRKFRRETLELQLKNIVIMLSWGQTIIVWEYSFFIIVWALIEFYYTRQFQLCSHFHCFWTQHPGINKLKGVLLELSHVFGDYLRHSKCCFGLWINVCEVYGQTYFIKNLKEGRQWRHLGPPFENAVKYLVPLFNPSIIIWRSFVLTSLIPMPDFCRSIDDGMCHKSFCLTHVLVCVSSWSSKGVKNYGFKAKKRFLQTQQINLADSSEKNTFIIGDSPQ